MGWYYRTFEVEKPKQWDGKETFLNFCANDFNTTVWINSKKVGAHSGGYTPFDFNISEFLIDGRNQIVVRVEDEELKNRPSGKQYYGNAKGIWQTVYLEARSKNYISLIHFTPNIDKQEVTAKMKFNEETKSASKFVLSGSDNSIYFKGEIVAKTNIASFTIPINTLFPQIFFQLSNSSKLI